MQDSVGKQDIAYIFDVDGTITPSRCHIDRHFASWFRDFAYKNKVYLVTGSDKPKTVQQIGNSLYCLCERVYNCNGSEVWEGDNLIHKYVIKKSSQLDSLYRDMFKILDFSPYPVRTGNHMENRDCMINFSILGRNSNLEQRNDYIKYDTMFKERERISKQLTELHGDHFEFMVAGDIGIDIVEKGKNKAQILKDFDNTYVKFFGDKVYEGGNDYPLKHALMERGYGVTYPVNGFNDTWSILKNDSGKNLGLD